MNESDILRAWEAAVSMAVSPDLKTESRILIVKAASFLFFAYTEERGPNGQSSS